MTAALWAGWAAMNRDWENRDKSASPAVEASANDPGANASAGDLGPAAAWSDGAAEQILELEADAVELENHSSRIWD
jgi:hypothetical protein